MPAECGNRLFIERVDAELNRPFEGRFKEKPFAVCAPDVGRGIAAGGEIEDDGGLCESEANRFDGAAVGAVKPVGNTKDRREAPDEAAVWGRKRGKGGVTSARFGTAVETSNQGDEFDLAAGQARKVAVRDDLLAVLVVACISDGVADIVEDRGRFEQEPGFVGHPVCAVAVRGELIEDREGEHRDVLTVIALVSE